MEPSLPDKTLPINLNLTGSLSDVIGFLSPLSQIAVEMIHNTSILNNNGNNTSLSDENGNDGSASFASSLGVTNHQSSIDIINDIPAYRSTRTLSMDRRYSDINELFPSHNVSLLRSPSYTALGMKNKNNFPTTTSGSTIPTERSTISHPHPYTGNGSTSTTNSNDNHPNSSNYPSLRSPIVSPLHPQLSPWLHPHVVRSQSNTTNNPSLNTPHLSASGLSLVPNLASPLFPSSVALSASSSATTTAPFQLGPNATITTHTNTSTIPTSLPNTQTFALPFARSRYSSLDSNYAHFVHDHTESTGATSTPSSTILNHHHHKSSSLPPHPIGVTPPIPPVSLLSSIPPVIREEPQHTEGLVNRYPRRHSSITHLANLLHTNGSTSTGTTNGNKEYDEPSSQNSSTSLSSSNVSNTSTPLILPSPALTIPNNTNTMNGPSSLINNGGYYPVSDRNVWYRRRQSSIVTVESVPGTPRSEGNNNNSTASSTSHSFGSTIPNHPMLSQHELTRQNSTDSGNGGYGRDRSNTLLSTNYYELDNGPSAVTNDHTTTTSLLPEISVEAGDIALLGLSRFVAKLANLTGVDLSNSNNTTIAPTNSAVVSITAEDTAVLGTLVEIIHAVMGYPLLQMGNINGMLSIDNNNNNTHNPSNTTNQDIIVDETINTASSSVSSSSSSSNLSALDTSTTVNNHPHSSQNIRSLGLGLPLLLMNSNNEGVPQPNVTIPSNTFTNSTFASGRSTDTFSNHSSGGTTTNRSLPTAHGSLYSMDTQLHATVSNNNMKRLSSTRSILDLNRNPNNYANNTNMNRRSSRARIALELGKTYAANPSIFDESTREFVESLVTPKNTKSTNNSVATNKLRTAAHTVGKLAVAAKLFSKGIKPTADGKTKSLDDNLVSSSVVPSIDTSDTVSSPPVVTKLDPLARRLPSVESTVFHGMENWTWDILAANREYVRNYHMVNKLYTPNANGNGPFSPPPLPRPFERHESSNAEMMIQDVLTTLETVSTSTNMTPFNPVANPSGSPSNVAASSSVSVPSSSSSSILPLSSHGPGAELLVAVTSYAMEKVGIIDEYRIDSQTLGTFLAHITKGYRSEQPYHNALHAADVTQALYHLLTEGGLAHHCPCHFRLALLVASACHDVGHPGVNNHYLLATGHPLALTYNDVSPLENMHAATMFLTMRKPGADILANLAPDTKRNVRQLMIALILATDNGQHFRMVAKLRRRFLKAFCMLPANDNSSSLDTPNRANQNGNDDDDDSDSDSDIEVLEDIDDEILTEIPIHQPIDLNKPNDSKLILSALLHACDIANPARPWTISNVWNDWVTQEFYSQGDKMRDYGLPVPPMHDRTHQPLSSSNMVAGFMKALCIPLWESLNHRVLRPICRIDPVLTGLQTNFTKHLEIIEHAKQEHEKQQQMQQQQQ